MYTAIVLDTPSAKKLKRALILLACERVVPLMDWREWNMKCHHCTLTMGDTGEYAFVDRTLKVTHVGFNELVIAFKVEGADDSKNATPHVTGAVEHRGKPVMSNDITNWIPIDHIELTGSVKICGLPLT